MELQRVIITWLALVVELWAVVATWRYVVPPLHPPTRMQLFDRLAALPITLVVLGSFVLNADTGLLTDPSGVRDYWYSRGTGMFGWAAFGGTLIFDTWAFFAFSRTIYCKWPTYSSSGAGYLKIRNVFSSSLLFVNFLMGSLLASVSGPAAYILDLSFLFIGVWFISQTGEEMGRCLKDIAASDAVAYNHNLVNK